MSKMTAEEIEKEMHKSGFYKSQEKEIELRNKIINDDLSEAELEKIYAEEFSQSIQELILSHPKCPLGLLREASGSKNQLLSHFAIQLLKNKSR